MLDLECLSTRPHAAIVIIGAIKFNRGEKWSENINKEELQKHDCFYRRIKIKSCIDKGLHIDPQTEQWWNNQDEKIRYEALENPTNRVGLKTALEDFKKWFNNNNTNFQNIKIWGNGSSFDCTILGEAYKRCNMEIPWKFWNIRDLRTIYDLGSIRSYELPQEGLHNALYDCLRQIIGFQRAEEKLLNR